MADFSGLAQGARPFAARRFDVDDPDRVLASIAPTLPITSGAEPAGNGTVTITSFDQFHPDHLAAAIPELRQLLELERRLEDPARAQDALTELDALLGPMPAAHDAETAVDGESAPNEPDDELLDRLLGRPRTESTSGHAKETVQRLIEDALGPTRAPQAPQRTADASSRVARLLDERCRRVLHSPPFRDVERAWRSIHWLASRLESEEAHVHLVDLAKEPLREHLADFADRLEASPLHRVLYDASAPWDLVIGDYSFGLAADDIVLLARLGALAARAEVPFAAHGDLSLAGLTAGAEIDAPWDWSFADAELGRLWNEFRAHPAARWTGLATPRFLLRHPFGPRNDPVARFDFEELPDEPDRESFLWGNPAFVWALVMGRAGADGARWPTAAGGGVEDLPMPIYRAHGGEAVQPPLEYLLTERARAAVEDHGLVALAGGANTNRIAVPSGHSLAAR